MIKEKIFFILVLIALVIVPVSAETLTGTLGQSNTIIQNSYTISPVSILTWGTNITFQTDEIERTNGMVTIIHFDPAGNRMTFDGGAPTYLANIPFTAVNSSYGVEGTGTMGYARSFNALGQEQAGYQYWIFNTYTGNLRSGKKHLVLYYNHTAFYNMQPGATYPSNPSANCNLLDHANSNVGLSFAAGFGGDSTITVLLGPIW